MRVTYESKHRRNIASFGPTTLRSTICYNLLRLANPKPGDIIIDPMCGGGSIPVEVCIHTINRSKTAITKLQLKINLSVFRNIY